MKLLVKFAKCGKACVVTGSSSSKFIISSTLCCLAVSAVGVGNAGSNGSPEMSSRLPNGSTNNCARQDVSSVPDLRPQPDVGCYLRNYHVHHL